MLQSRSRHIIDLDLEFYNMDLDLRKRSRNVYLANLGLEYSRTRY